MKQIVFLISAFSLLSLNAQTTISGKVTDKKGVPIDGANVYLTSAELASVGGILGRLPTVEEYMEYATKINSMSSEIYRYMNFDQIESFQKSAEEGKLIAAEQIIEVA